MGRRIITAGMILLVRQAIVKETIGTRITFIIAPATLQRN